MTITAAYDLIAIDRLHESKTNRRHTDPAKLKELIESVKTHGVLTPILVRPNDDGFEIAAGNRRFKAAKAAGLKELPAIVRDMDDAQFLEVQTIENLLRDDLHPLDEAHGYRQLLELLDLSDGRPLYDVEAIAGKVHKSASYVYQRLQLTKLVKPAKESFLEDKISAGHATDIARLAPDDQLEALKAATGKLPNYRNDPLSVRELRSWIQDNVLRDLGKAPWDLDDAELLPRAGACFGCPKRSANNPELFGDLAKGDRCMDSPCHAAKLDAWIERKRQEAKANGEKLKVVDLSMMYSSRTKGVVAEEKWQRAGAQKCDDLALGVIVETYPNPRPEETRGTLVKVCLNKGKCRIHNPRDRASSSGRSRSSSTSSSSGSGDTWKVKQEKTKRLHGRVFELVRHKIKTPLTKPDLELLIIEELLYGDGTAVLAEAYGWKDKDLRGEPAVKKLVTALPLNDLSRLLVEIALARDADGYSGHPRTLHAFAERYGVDVKKVEAELKAADVAKAKEGKAAKAKGAAKTPAPKKKAKK